MSRRASRQPPLLKLWLDFRQSCVSISCHLLFLSPSGSPESDRVFLRPERSGLTVFLEPGRTLLRLALPAPPGEKQRSRHRDTADEYCFYHVEDIHASDHFIYL